MSQTPIGNDVLGQLALAADPPADKIVGDVVASLHIRPGDRTGRSARRLPRADAEIGRDEAPFGELRPAEAPKSTPDQAEARAHAQGFFEEHGVAVITALFLASLPQAYLGRRGVQTLDMTGELVSQLEPTNPGDGPVPDQRPNTGSHDG